MDRRVHETRELLLNGSTKVERTDREAAAEYIADLESRGKDSARALLIAGAGETAGGGGADCEARTPNGGGVLTLRIGERG